MRTTTSAKMRGKDRQPSSKAIASSENSTISGLMITCRFSSKDQQWVCLICWRCASIGPTCCALAVPELDLDHRPEAFHTQLQGMQGSLWSGMYVCQLLRPSPCMKDPDRPAATLSSRSGQAQPTPPLTHSKLVHALQPKLT